MLEWRGGGYSQRRAPPTAGSGRDASAQLELSYPNEQDAAFAAARSFAPLSPKQLEDIRRRAVVARRDKGPCWWNPDPER